MQWPTPRNADSSKTRINRLIAEPSTVQVKVSVDLSETVISKPDAELRLVVAAANAVSSRTRTAKRRVEQRWATDSKRHSGVGQHFDLPAPNQTMIRRHIL